MNRLVGPIAAAMAVAVATVAVVAIFWSSALGAPRTRPAAGTQVTAGERVSGVKPNPGVDAAREALELAQAKERIASLENQIAGMGAALERTDETPGKADESNPLEAFRSASDKAFKNFEKAALSGQGPLPTATGGVALTLADMLGLDPQRRALFLQAYEPLMDRVKAIEAGRCKVTREGESIKIEIPAFPEEAKTLGAEWARQVDPLLTPEEKDLYEKFHMANMVNRRFGNDSRTIIIKHHGGKVYINETKEGPNGLSSTCTAGQPDTEAALAPYRHLLR